MVDWQSTAEIVKDADAFTKLMHALLGLYAWEFALSLGFEWDFITGKKKFKWPMIFYFAGRYLLLFSFIGIATALDATNEINCQALYTFNQLAGNAAQGLASINLSIRTMAIWSGNTYIKAGLIVIILGHWSLILQGVLLTATWVDGTGCVIVKTNTTVLAATFIYSMAFDGIVLTLNTFKLAMTGTSARGGGSRLGRMIFADGLIFFLIAFLANTIATVFMVLNLNSVMSVMFNVPAVVASTIVASRVVRRLTNFTQQAEVYSKSGTVSDGAGRTGATRSTTGAGARPGVHVQMETFHHKEDPTLDNPYERSVAKDIEAFRESDKSSEVDVYKQPF
ncbi:hypothetical protein PLICRDRAFT_43536 [Plicaturopsis crispa FD-325 SS-3]|nr:hypothetical protein PLICRDRAFT_43536 [Plicaturopsis crispa FD-325 SS-3]